MKFPVFWLNPARTTDSLTYIYRNREVSRRAGCGIVIFLRDVATSPQLKQSSPHWKTREVLLAKNVIYECAKPRSPFLRYVCIREFSLPPPPYPSHLPPPHPSHFRHSVQAPHVEAADAAANFIISAPRTEKDVCAIRIAMQRRESWSLIKIAFLSGRSITETDR